MKQLHRKPKPKYLLALFILIFLGLLILAFFKTAEWFDNHTIQKNRILSMEWKMPITIQERKSGIVEKVVLPEYPGEIDTPIKTYICDKFGVYECKIALGIVEAESKFNSEAWNINSNGTIDVGLWQINSVHFNQEGCSIKEALDPIRATDCAYNIYKASGWNAWTTFLNNSYMAHL